MKKQLCQFVLILITLNFCLSVQNKQIFSFLNKKNSEKVEDVEENFTDEEENYTNNNETKQSVQSLFNNSSNENNDNDNLDKEGDGFDLVNLVEKNSNTISRPTISVDDEEENEKDNENLQDYNNSSKTKNFRKSDVNERTEKEMSYRNDMEENYSKNEDDSDYDDDNGVNMAKEIKEDNNRIEEREKLKKKSTMEANKAHPIRGSVSDSDGEDYSDDDTTRRKAHIKKNKSNLNKKPVVTNNDLESNDNLEEDNNEKTENSDEIKDNTDKAKGDNGIDLNAVDKKDILKSSKPTSDDNNMKEDNQEKMKPDVKENLKKEGNDTENEKSETSDLKETPAEKERETTEKIETSKLKEGKDEIINEKIDTIDSVKKETTEKLDVKKETTVKLDVKKHREGGDDKMDTVPAPIEELTPEIPDEKDNNLKETNDSEKDKKVLPARKGTKRHRLSRKLKSNKTRKNRNRKSLTKKNQLKIKKIKKNKSAEKSKIVGIKKPTDLKMNFQNAFELIVDQLEKINYKLDNIKN